MRMKTVKIFILCSVAALFFASCMTAPLGEWKQDTIAARIRKKKALKEPSAESEPAHKSAAEINTSKPPEKKEEPGNKYTELQQKLVEGAYAILGQKELNINGKHFNVDCTGTVLAAYYYAGIDLAKDFAKYTGNGVKRLYDYLEANELLYKTKSPAPGDIIFWDDTYDKNGDGKWNDPLTHTGMVVSITEDGEIEYLHENYKKGIILEKMNLQDPDTYQKSIDGEMVIINSPMRMRSAPKGPKWLASQLMRIFGMGYKLP